MPRRVIVLLLCCLAGCKGRPAPTSSGKDGAASRPAAPPGRLVLERRFIDLGRLEPHSTQEVSVRLRNAGKGALVVSKVETGCKCILAELRRKRIEPGKSVSLALDVRTLKHRGPYDARIAIASDDPAGVTILAMRFEVPRVIAAEPPKLYLGVARPGQEIARRVKLVADKGVSTEVVRAVSSDPSVVGRIVAPAVGNGKAGLLEVVVTAPAKPGLYRHRLNIATALGAKASAKVPVILSVSRAASVDPGRIDFGRFGQGDGPERSVRLRLGEGTSLAAAVPHPLVLNVKIAPPDEAGEVTVKLRPKKEIPFGPIDGELRLHLDGTERTVLAVPFTGYVAEGEHP